MLKIENFSKCYQQGVYAVKNLNLEIASGDIYAFIGHNGAGKTTTLKSIVGILPIEEGNIYIDGVSIKDNSVECKRKIAYIPDNPDIYDSLTGKNFLNFVASSYGVDKTTREERIKKYADLFEMSDHLNEYISSYSHGMKQKLLFIASFIHDAKLMILDEPFVGLDPKASHLVKELMKEFVSSGNAIFFSTHVLEVAEKLCNKVAIIKKGELIINGEMDVITKENDLETIFLEN